MNIKALRAFSHTLSEGSIAGASAIMHLSQPAVSRLISALEGELRLELFHRTGRRLVPTPEGLAFYREAGRILDNLDEIPRIAADIRGGRTETVRLVTMPRIAAALASPAVTAFMARVPQARVNLDVRARREAGKWLAGREYDLGVGALPVDHPDIGTELLIRARAQAVMPAGHALAARDEIRAEDLAGQPLITLMPGLLLRHQVDDLFRSAGLNPKYACEVASSQLACQLVADGAGITIADSLTTQPLGERVVLRPVVPERWMSFGLLLPVSAAPSANGRALADCLRDRARALAAGDPHLRVDP